jgi:4,4'-diaponeurosporenoate glycosyltransferase
MAFQINHFVFWCGLVVLIYRLSDKLTNRQNKTDKSFHQVPPVSDFKELAIVIPARNEALSLPPLLESLHPMMRAGAKVIVVDDQSTDGTGEIALKSGADVVQTEPKPHDWSGKNWACHQGALHLDKINFSGKYVLFTDADTVHQEEGLRKALVWFQEQEAVLMTAVPYHRNPDFWEKLLGPFHLMVLMITHAVNEKPTPSRFFSIGQFLLFRYDYYLKSQGHVLIKDQLADDLALTSLCFKDADLKRFYPSFNNKSPFVVYQKTPIYSTRMYANPRDFYLGWQRNFRLGMPYSSNLTWFETILIIAALLGSQTFWSYSLIVLLLMTFQGQRGNFSKWGALFYPLSLFIFIFISLSASLKTMFKKPIVWKAREYLQKSS